MFMRIACRQLLSIIFRSANCADFIFKSAFCAVIDHFCTIFNCMSARFTAGSMAGNLQLSFRHFLLTVFVEKQFMTIRTDIVRTRAALFARRKGCGNRAQTMRSFIKSPTFIVGKAIAAIRAIASGLGVTIFRTGCRLRFSNSDRSYCVAAFSTGYSSKAQRRDRQQHQQRQHKRKASFACFFHVCFAPSFNLVVKLFRRMGIRRYRTFNHSMILQKNQHRTFRFHWKQSTVW